MPARSGAEHERMHVLACADELTHSLHRFALADDDFRLDPAFVEDLSDRRADDSFDAQALFFLDRGLDTPELHEILRLDDSQHLDPPVGLGRSTRGEAQRDGSFGTVVDDDEISTFRIVPHSKRLLR